MANPWRTYLVITTQQVERRYAIKARSADEAMDIVDIGDPDPEDIIYWDEELKRFPREIKDAIRSN